MPKRIDQAITAELHHAFQTCNFDAKLATIRMSDQAGVDYQCDSAIRIAKALGLQGPAVAQLIADAIKNDGTIQKAWVSGPGFINILASKSALVCGLGLKPTQFQQSVVIDFGGPNIAKPLHVGHLRSLAIGESLRRVLIETGHQVIADIHYGDYGLQMGILVAAIEDKYAEAPLFDQHGLTDAATSLTVTDLEQLYPQASRRSKEEPDFLARARAATTALQSHAHNGYTAIWHHMRHLSLSHVMHDIERLDARFDLLLGESDVGDDLEPMLADLIDADVATHSEGAIIVDVAEEQDGKRPMPPLILKTQAGSYTYAATDLATIKVRFGSMRTDKVIYVTDDRQIDHFTQLSRAALKAGYTDIGSITHVPFGTVNGPDGKPFKTRDGGTAKLSDLIDLAIANVTTKSPGLNQRDIQVIAIGAVKFADLVTARTSGYAFDIEKATATEGKTGVYLQYAAVRMAAILSDSTFIDDVDLPTPAARQLALTICRTPLIIDQTLAKLQPHILANHGWTLASAFNALYAETRILDNENPQRSAQLVWLCRAAHEDLCRVLDLLGIGVPSQM